MFVVGELSKDYEYFYEKITTFQEINMNEKKEELFQIIEQSKVNNKKNSCQIN